MYLCTLKLPLKSKFIFRIIRNFHSFNPPTPFRPQNYSSYLGRGVPTVGIRRETINAWEVFLKIFNLKKLIKEKSSINTKSCKSFDKEGGSSNYSTIK